MTHDNDSGMRAVLVLAALCGAVALSSACNCGHSSGGDDAQDSGWVDDGGGGGTGGDGGNGAGGGTGGDGGGGSGDGGNACNPVDQTGCSGAQSKCGIVGNTFGCQAPGNSPQGGACTPTASGDDCQSGLFCMNFKCERFCDPGRGSNACPSGQTCSLQVTWNGGPPDGERFYACVVQGDECDVLAQNCSDVAKGCYPTNAGHKCLMPGSTSDGQPCSSANDCKKGSACLSFGMGLKCYQMCTPPRPDGGTDAGAQVSCTSGTCTATTFGFGACQ